MKDKKKRHLIPLLAFAAGLALIFYPSASKAASGIRGRFSLDAYGRYEKNLSERERDEAFLKARGYNRRLALLREEIPFSCQGADAETEEYRNLLAGPDGQMAFLEIPALFLTLPVLHGTSEETLEGSAGHMFGTSLPVGGPDTHCVIAGHSGLPTAELFTNVSRLGAGDDLYLHVLGERLHYRIRRVLVVQPEMADTYLQIEKGADLLTLYTCTPAGINDRRLLAEAVRVKGPG